jgi:hypothetical protein
LVLAIDSRLKWQCGRAHRRRRLEPNPTYKPFMDDKSISDANILPDRHIKQSSKPVIIPYTSPDQSSPFVPSRCPITSLGHGFSLWVMYLPQEIHDRIIDFLADTPGIQKDTLGLRLVCRAWIPRLNFHVFRNLRMEVAHCPMLLSTVKSSKFSIGTSVRCLFVYGEDFQTARTVFPYQNDAVALQGYLRDLVEHLPYLETLNLADLFPDQMAWIPCFPSIKSLNLFDISMRPSQLLQIISTARSLENLRSSCCDLYAEGDGLPLVSPTSLLSLENLRSYETFLFANDDRVFLDSHLFPIKFEPKLPSLSRLSLGRVHPETMSIALHLMKAVSQSLRFLQLWFRRTYSQTESMLLVSYRSATGTVIANPIDRLSAIIRLFPL